MRSLKIRVGLVADVEPMLKDIPEGWTIRFDPAHESKAPPGMAFDDAESIMNFIIDHSGKVVDAVAAKLLVEHLAKLPGWLKGRFWKANGQLLPDDPAARRQKLLDMMNDPKD